MTISTDDVRRLLQTDVPDSVLVLLEGRTEVVGASQLASEQYRGALEVVSRDDLVKRLGDAPSEHDLAEQAALLDTAISELGG
jgi:delta 1-pyrroline-5-carboxylate dehydrogenase